MPQLDGFLYVCLENKDESTYLRCVKYFSIPNDLPNILAKLRSETPCI